MQWVRLLSLLQLLLRLQLRYVWLLLRQRPHGRCRFYISNETSSQYNLCLSSNSTRRWCHPCRPTGPKSIFCPSYGCSLRIEGWGSKPLLTIDPNAFLSSRNLNSSLFQFELFSIDTSRLDLQFLSNLGNNLTMLDFRDLVNFGRSLLART